MDGQAGPLLRWVAVGQRRKAPEGGQSTHTHLERCVEWNQQVVRSLPHTTLSPSHCGNEGDGTEGELPWGGGGGTEIQIIHPSTPMRPERCCLIPLGMTTSVQLRKMSRLLSNASAASRSVHVPGDAQDREAAAS
eukprot:1071812-Pelagomonas_calceolata.AAC.1